MKQARDEVETSARTDGQTHRKKRRRKKLYTDHIYGARLAHEDARIVDDYARLKGLERSDVVRLGLHQFALRQQMKYQPKDEFQELQEKVFREHFAALSEQLETISATLRELPQEASETRAQHDLLAPRHHSENGKAPLDGDAKVNELTPRVESLLREQKSALEQVLLASTLALRLLANHLVEPQLHHLESSNPSSLKSHLRAAELGKASWSPVTAEVMRRTGNQMLVELHLDTPTTKSGTADAPQTDAQKTVAILTDADIASAL